MKNILMKTIVAVMVLALTLTSLVACFNKPDDQTGDNKLTKEKAIEMLSKAAFDYTGLELDEFVEKDEASVKKFPLFLKMDQDDFTKFMTPSVLEEDEVLKDSKYFFNYAASTAYILMKHYKDFEFSKSYNLSLTDAEGNTLDTVDCYPVSVVDAEDGGFYILLYNDSVLENETIQLVYYITVENKVSVVESMAIYAGENSDGTGTVITDYVQFISGKTTETASIKFDFDTADRAREVSKSLSREPKLMKEIKANVKTLDYTYAVYENDAWTCNSVNIVKEDSWTSFMKDLYKAMQNHIDLYGADFENMFTKLLNEVEIPESVLLPDEDNSESGTEDTTEIPDNDETTESESENTETTESESESENTTETTESDSETTETTESESENTTETTESDSETTETTESESENTTETTESESENTETTESDSETTETTESESENTETTESETESTETTESESENTETTESETESTENDSEESNNAT